MNAHRSGLAPILAALAAVTLAVALLVAGMVAAVADDTSPTPTTEAPTSAPTSDTSEPTSEPAPSEPAPSTSEPTLPTVTPSRDVCDMPHRCDQTPPPTHVDPLPKVPTGGSIEHDSNRHRTVTKVKDAGGEVIGERVTRYDTSDLEEGL